VVIGGEEEHGEDKKNRRRKKQGRRGTRSLGLHYCFYFCGDASPPPELVMCTIATSNSNNKREGRRGGREQGNNNNNNAAKPNYNQIRILILFFGILVGGGRGVGCVAKIGNHPQEEDLAKLAIIHKTKF
jgi:hypothetical protein